MIAILLGVAAICGVFAPDFGFKMVSVVIISVWSIAIAIR